MTEIVFLYTTAPDMETAQRIAETLIEARLAACANIIPGMRSVYRWNDKIETGDEIVAIFKTRSELADAAAAMIERHHPYEIPCVVALATARPGSNPAYIDWLTGETDR